MCALLLTESVQPGCSWIREKNEEKDRWCWWWWRWWWEEWFLRWNILYFFPSLSVIIVSHNIFCNRNTYTATKYTDIMMHSVVSRMWGNFMWTSFFNFFCFFWWRLGGKKFHVACWGHILTMMMIKLLHVNQCVSSDNLEQEKDKNIKTAPSNFVFLVRVLMCPWLYFYSSCILSE